MPKVKSFKKGRQRPATSLVCGETCTSLCCGIPFRPSRPMGKGIAKKVTGIVQFYNVEKRFGFITRNDTKEDIYVNQKDINGIWLDNDPPRKGELVEFDVATRIQ